MREWEEGRRAFLFCGNLREGEEGKGRGETRAIGGRGMGEEILGDFGLDNER